MATTKVSASDKKDLDKYTKFLVLKMTQAIVQSRLGEKVCTPCRPQSSGADWFSLAVPDLPDVATEARRWLCPETGRARIPYCVEISLRTAEGERLALETWALSAAPDGSIPQTQDSGRLTPGILYGRMGKLLKSLLCVTRAAPAYRLSRRQCPHSYAIYYRICSGEDSKPEPVSSLGEGHRNLRVGQLATPTGPLQLTVAFRTRMTIAPSPAGRAPLLLDSHHFTVPAGPTCGAASPPNTPPRRVDLDKPMRAGAFVDVSRVRQYTESDFVLPEEPPFSWLLSREDVEEENGTTENGSDVGDLLKSEHEASLSKSPVPLEIKEEDETLLDVEDDKLMDELHFPFAIADKCPIAKLAGFYRECYRAPQLQTFAEERDPSPVLDLTRQLELFETSLEEYDEMISSLCHSPNNN